MTPQLDGKGCTFCKAMQVEEHSMQFQEAQKGFLSLLKKKKKYLQNLFIDYCKQAQK